VSYEKPPQEQTPAFTGTSAESREEALHDAAERAQTFFKEQGREGKVFLQVVREEVAIGNPHITEWRIIIAESGGG
jgi:flavin-binding protein dodecin